MLPCADVTSRGAGVADGLSFFYDESEAVQCEEDDEGMFITVTRCFHCIRSFC